MTWHALHAHYHGDRDRLLTGWLRPVLPELFSESRIERCFFVRFDLGGPHVRVRLDLADGAAEAVLRRVEQTAREYFERAPSTVYLDEEIIRQRSRGLLEIDPNEDDDAIYPDNSIRRTTFRPEVERYGGAGFLEPNLDAFTLSSLRTLDFLAEHRELPRSRLLTQILRLLLRQVLGLAPAAGSWAVLLESLAGAWGESLTTVARRGDQIFEQQREVFLALLGRELDALGEDGGEASFGTVGGDLAAARALAEAVATAPPAARLRIAASQLHMTNNRLGLHNAEEVYLARLASRVLHEATTHDPGAAEAVRAILECPSPPSLQAQVAAATASFTAASR